MESSTFSGLALKPNLLGNLDSLGYKQMTPIQAASLPEMLAGSDVIAQAKTGSGKTAAFGLALLEKLRVKQFRIQSLVLCPTRELADQVAKEIRRLARGIHNIKVLTLCGGMPFGPQVGSLEHGAHIIVGTPGRIEEHLRKGKLDLQHVQTLVLDEADRMLDMGFQETLDAIIAKVPKQRQTLLFSATYPDEIQAISASVMNKPKRVQLKEVHDQQSIQQYLVHVPADMQRISALCLLLQEHRPDSTLVFCNTRQETKEVAEQLKQFGFMARALHGDLEQKDRDQTLVQFSNGSISVLVATDVAARGLDIESLAAVVNYRIANDLEVHVHRIGRTGRAGSQGLACTLYDDKEKYKVGRLTEYLGNKLPQQSLPAIKLLDEPRFKPAMRTLQIDGGKKQKVRPGDILGALTGEGGIAGSDVGKIQIANNWAFIAVRGSVIAAALSKLSNGKIKGRRFRVREL